MMHFLREGTNLCNNSLNSKCLNLFRKQMVLCLLGDLVLLHEHKGEVYFQMGILFFTMAHLHHNMMNLSLIKDIMNMGNVVLLLVMTLVLGSVYMWLEKDIGVDLKVAVGGYVIVLGSMGYLNLCRRSYGQPAFWRGALGSILFILSDFIIAVNHFKHLHHPFI